MKKVRTLLWGAGLSCAACMVACGSSDGGPPPLEVPAASGGADGFATLHAGATVVSRELADAADVESDRVVFPASAMAALGARKAGDVLIGDRMRPGAGGKNPDGFLRKVVSVASAADAEKGEGVVVMTSAATLEDAVDAARIHGTLQVPDLALDGPVSAQAASGLLHPETGGSGGTTLKLLDFSGKSLLAYSDTAKTSDGKTTVPFTVTAGIDTGTLAFSPKYTVDADLGFLTVNSFSVSATGALDAKLVFDLAVKLDPSVTAATKNDLQGQTLTKSYEATLADYDVDLGSLDLGPLTLPASAHYTTTLSCDLSFTAPVEVKVGGEAAGSITATLAYDGSNVGVTFDKSATFTPTPPAFTNSGMVRAYCQVSPKFELKLFGVATGDLEATAYAGIGGSQTCGGKDASGITQHLIHGDAAAGLSAQVSADVNVFGLYKWKKACTLFDLSDSVEYDTAYPDPGGASAPACKVAGPFPLPPAPPAAPAACFAGDATTTSDGPSSDDTSGGSDASDTSAPIAGSCTHDVCSAGDKLGQACDDCTMKVCAVDSYCCDTYWGLSCFDDVAKLCGETCSE